MKLNHIYKSIACGVLLAMTATSCDLDYNPVDTYSDVTEGVNKTDSFRSHYVNTISVIRTH